MLVQVFGRYKRDSIPSPWMEAVFPDHWLGGIPLPKYGQRWGFP